MGWRIHTGTGLPRFRAGWVRMTRATRNAAWSRASFPELVPTIAFSTLPRSLTNIHTWVVPSMPCSIMPEARYSRTTACSISFLLKSDPTTTLTSSSATLGAEAHPAARITATNTEAGPLRNGAPRFEPRVVPPTLYHTFRIFIIGITVPPGLRCACWHQLDRLFDTVAYGLPCRNLLLQMFDLVPKKTPWTPGPIRFRCLLGNARVRADDGRDHHADRTDRVGNFTGGGGPAACQRAEKVMGRPIHTGTGLFLRSAGLSR